MNELPTTFEERFDLAMELTDAADLETVAEAIEILDSIGWDYEAALLVLDGRKGIER